MSSGRKSDEPSAGSDKQGNQEDSKLQPKNGINNKVFKDPVHGLMEMEPILVKIIDTPQFQRLRNIKQLGGCYFVFPGAAHNRFEHSLGVAHLAGQFVGEIKKNQPDLGITDNDILCVKIAGLCHDLGHGPFSHAFDGMFIPKARPGVKWKHEQASVDMFDHLLEENGLKKEFEELDIEFIKEMINGPQSSQQGDEGDEDENAKEIAEKATQGDHKLAKEDDVVQDWPYKGRTEEKSFLYEIISNKSTGIDVDKWDYFARDSHNLGIQNNFDHMRFMKFARVIRVGERKRRHICIRDKESNNMYDMFLTRNCLHRRAYQHKTANIIEYMIIEAMLKANDYVDKLEGEGGKKLKMSEAIVDMTAYTKLTDKILDKISLSTDDNLKESRGILERVEKRQLYKYIGNIVLSKNTEFSKGAEDEIAKEIAEKAAQGDHKLAKEDVIVQIVKFDYGMKKKDPINELWFYSKNDPSKAFHRRKEEISNLLPETFFEQHVRLYCKKQNQNIDMEKLKECIKELEANPQLQEISDQSPHP